MLRGRKMSKSQLYRPERAAINVYHKIKNSDTSSFKRGQTIYIDTGDGLAGWFMVTNLEPFEMSFADGISPKQRKKLGLKKGEVRY